MKRWIVLSFVVLHVSWSLPLWAENRVKTYVIKVQEERESTKWTLTEWLRIKERMKMMDLWLAMFSEPNKDRFRPELHLSLQNASGQFDREDVSGERFLAARGQLWLTNLFSGTLGLKLLNIDIGIEGGARQNTDSAEGLGAAIADANADLSHYSGNLRIFGKHIQDTSLILKYGAYDLQRAVPIELLAAASQVQKGVFLGAELQIYLLRYLGLLGNYHSFEPKSGAAGVDLLKGQYFDYGVFVDVAILRIAAGQYQSQWDFDGAAMPMLTNASGRFFALSLQI